MKNGKTKLAPSEGPYALLPYAMLQSAAWRSLSGQAVKVFLELRTRFHGMNNGALTFSLEEGKRLLSLGKTTVLRALVELQDKGLIVCTKKGQWYGRLASTWAVTDRPMMDGTVATNAWEAWRQSPACHGIRDAGCRQPSTGPVADPSAQKRGAKVRMKKTDPRSCSGPVGQILGPVADPSAIRQPSTGPVADPSAQNPRSCSGPLVSVLIKGGSSYSKDLSSGGGRSEPRARGRHGSASAHAPDTVGNTITGARHKSPPTGE